MKALPWIAGIVVAAVTFGAAGVGLGYALDDADDGNMQDHMAGNAGMMGMSGTMGMSEGDWTTMQEHMAQHMSGESMPGHDQHHGANP